MDPFASNTTLFSRKQRKSKQKFDSANSLDAMVKAFKDLELCSTEKDLGFPCWQMARKYQLEHEDPEKVLYFASRALNIMTENDKNGIGSSSSSSAGRLSLSLPIVGSLQLLGYACYKLTRFDESLGYLNWAAIMLENLRDDTSYRNNIVLASLNDVERQLFIVKDTMGKSEEAISHLRKNLEITEKISGKDSKDLAKANREVCDVYLAEMNYRDALPYCLKAMDIYKVIYGDESEEVAECMQHLAHIYCGLRELEESLKQNLSSQKVLKNLGSTSLLIRAEIESAYILKHLGRFEEAIEILRSVVPHTEKLRQDRIIALTSMAEVFCCQGKFSEARRCANKVREILYKREKSNTLEVAVEFEKIACVYETLKDFDTALSLLKRVPPILEKLPREMLLLPYLLDISLRIGELLILNGKPEQAIPYLEEGVETMKKSFGPKHSKVGYAYHTLGDAYYNSKKLQLAAQVLGYAKDILDESLGPHHRDSIIVCKNLCRTYLAPGSYSLAMNILEETIERQKALGPSAQNEVVEGTRMLALLKERINDDISTGVKEVALNEALSANNSLSTTRDNYSPAVNLQEKVFKDLKEQNQHVEDEVTAGAEVPLEPSKKKKKKSKKANLDVMKSLEDF